MNRRRVILVGIDSLSPILTERFLAAGKLPALAGLRDRGFTSALAPTMPPSTPTGWTAVTTGTWGSTSGIEGFSLHRRGRAFDRRLPGCSTEHCRTEFIWNTLERAGRLPVLLKFPISWPPTVDRGIQIDGAAGWGGLKCVSDLAYSSCFRSDADGESSGTEEARLGPSQWATRDQDNLDEESVRPLRVAKSAGWVNQPDDVHVVWEAEMRLPVRKSVVAPPWFVAAVATARGARLAVAPERDFGQVQAMLAAGEWSGWLRGRFRCDDAEVDGPFRVKLMEFDLEGAHCALYVSQVHRASGFTRPDHVAADLLRDVGPFPEWTESYDLLQGWIDHDTQLEIYREHIRWMTAAAHWLMSRYEWDLFMTHTHIVDMAQHIYWGAVDPAHPEYRASAAPRFWALLEETYRLADTMVDSLLRAAGPNDLVLVLGDHGQDVYHTTLMTNALLIRLGLLYVFRDPSSGAACVDWKRTEAYAASNHVFVNLRGRDPDGIVPSERYEAVRQRIVESLQELVDPRTGSRPVRYAEVREAWAPFGLYGDGVGDVIFATSRGYQTRSALNIPAAAWVGSRVIPPKVELFRQTRLFRDFTGEHDTSFPMDTAIQTLLFAKGPGVPAGVRRPVPVRMVDIAPTIARYLGIEPPRHWEGAAVADLCGAGAER